MESQEKSVKMQAAINQISAVIISFVPESDALKSFPFSKPPTGIQADISFPCHKIASRLKKSPQTLAETIAKGLESLSVIDSVSVTYGYINMCLNMDAIYNS